jgi:hypothetical protein
MAANENPSPFTSRGTLRPAAELEAIAGNLEPQRLQLWNDLVAAARECEQAEAHAKDCSDATAAAVRAANEVRSAMPKFTHYDLWKEVVKGIPMSRSR